MTRTSIHRNPFLFTLLLLITANLPALHAAEGPAKHRPPLPGEACQTEPLEGWTTQEKWVWSQICVGKIADFNNAGGYGGKLDPKKLEGWLASRVLRPAFLETVLLYEPYRAVLTRVGVRIVGAWFIEPLDLSNATLGHPLWLDDSRFESYVDLSYVRTPHLISLQGSKFVGQLNMNNLQVDSNLFMRRAELSGVTLHGAHIKGQLSVAGATFAAGFNMENLTVAGGLFMNGGRFAEVMLRAARVGDQVNMIGSVFTRTLYMLGLEVGGSLFMREKAQFAEVILRGAHIRGQLEMSGATFNGPLYMDSLRVDGSLIADGGTSYFAPVVLRGAHVGGQIGMVGTNFDAKVDMGNLRVGLTPCSWTV